MLPSSPPYLKKPPPTPTNAPAKTKIENTQTHEGKVETRKTNPRDPHANRKSNLATVKRVLPHHTNPTHSGVVKAKAGARNVKTEGNPATLTTVMAVNS